MVRSQCSDRLRTSCDHGPPADRPVQQIASHSIEWPLVLRVGEIYMEDRQLRLIDLGYIFELYKEFAGELAAVGKAQREYADSMKASMTPQLDDLEAEITYLLLRATRPAAVVELGTFHGWSTMWILSALRDNGCGHLHSFDLIDNVVRNVPAELADDRWTFVRGDIMQTVEQVPGDTAYLFVDAAHTGRFARWYLDHLFPRVPAQSTVSVHDVFHFRTTLPLHEGRVVVRWLDGRGVP